MSSRKYCIYPMQPELFSKYLWEGGTVYLAFGFSLRYTNLIKHKYELINNAVGYCRGVDLFFRRKENETAVMFETCGARWWTHLRDAEFDALYKNTGTIGHEYGKEEAKA